MYHVHIVRSLLPAWNPPQGRTDRFEYLARWLLHMSTLNRRRSTGYDAPASFEVLLDRASLFGFFLQGLPLTGLFSLQQTAARHGA